MRNCVMTRWDLTPEEKFEAFLRELKEFLKSKLIRKTRPGITPLWSCIANGYDHYDQLDNLKDFCNTRNFVWREVKMMIDEYYDYDCHCDCHILQAMESAGIQPNRRFIGGMWRYECFPDECYEIITEPSQANYIFEWNN